MSPIHVHNDSHGKEIKVEGIKMGHWRYSQIQLQ
jgi:hypothetical protein